MLIAARVRQVDIIRVSAMILIPKATFVKRDEHTRF